MQKLIFILLIISGGQVLAQTSLPKPSARLMKMDGSEEKGYTYLEENFKKLGDKKILQSLDDCRKDCACSWEQQFDIGICYHREACDDGGFTITITFSRHTPDDLVRLVDTLFKTPSNVWNKDRTTYNQKDDLPGCYYTIKKITAATVLEYYCGC